MRVLISRLMALCIHLFARIFFRFEVSWVAQQPKEAFKNVRVFAFLNHTSLWEPLFLGACPLHFLWDAARRTTVPGADKTMNRPLVGRFYKYFTPRTVSISRKRDNTWDGFLDGIASDSLVAIAPEGRMKRSNGLDAKGNPMSVRGGIADILCFLKQGKMLIAYSGGLHHVNSPGERKLRLFKTLHMRFEILDIETYLHSFGEHSNLHLRKIIAQDLEERLRQNQPDSN